MLRTMPDHREPAGHAHALHVPPRAFLRSAARNITGSASEFLPGLLLPPLVLQLQGPQPSAYFYIAWTGASTLFLLSAAICRSAFAEMSRLGPESAPRLLRRAARHHLVIVAPLALAAMASAPLVLGLFGPGYRAQGLGVFLLLAGSVALVAPVYLFLALLRFREERVLLVAYPAVNVALLFLLAPPLEDRAGLAGVGLAWLLTHTPLALYALLRLRRATKEVTHADAEGAPAHGGAAHLE
jgi:O-antigen/teichoic acid export membrane protein